MEKSPLVSVGIAAYNRPDSLRKALHCLTNQTYRNLELIVSDDCSPKVEVSQVVNAIAASDSRIKFYRQSRNLGAISNIDFVLQQATGEYFLWSDDEDLCEPDFVEKLVACMEMQPELAACACDTKIVDQQDSLVRIQRLDTIRPSENWRDTRKLFFRYPTSNIYLCILGMFKTQIVKKVGARNLVGWKGYGTNGEVPFLAQIATYGKIAAIPEVLKTYRLHPDSVYHSEIASMPWLDQFMLRLTIRLRLCKIAFGCDESVIGKLLLLSTVLSSLAVSVTRGCLNKSKRFVEILFPERCKRPQH